MSTGLTDDTSRRARRRKLARMQPSEIKCRVPGCKDGRVTEHCCYRHSIDIPGAEKGTFLANDGVMDDMAIDLAVEGSRVVRLTWVEFEIAVARLMNAGHSYEEIRERTGVKSSRFNSTRAPVFFDR